MISQYFKDIRMKLKTYGVPTATGKCQVLKAIKDEEKIDNLQEGILC